jgi:DnaJ-class molecular chaperone
VKDKRKQQCPKCAGTGRVIRTSQQGKRIYAPCPTCNGRGYVYV